MFLRNLSIVALSMLLLAACAPATSNPNKIAVVNAPAENRVLGFAQALQEHLKNARPAPTYTFISDTAARYQESHRDIAYSRAPLQAAFIARATNARYTVMISAPVLDRDVEVSTRNPLKKTISVNLQLEISIIEPENATQVAHFTSPVYTYTRIEFTDEDLPDEPDDPTILELLDKALNKLTPHVALELNRLMQVQASVQ